MDDGSLRLKDTFGIGSSVIVLKDETRRPEALGDFLLWAATMVKG